ncbi:hypothetical protein [Pseudomarimonas arenosa]|uniref:Helix-turn-helix domain-containing protein n=1 Tax=Pseudomarimonas arenosa TaxID=2774145 RepID=A0AAW3ZRS1_9GAMM|nr:hypothetical protein [Pseudomarimonas arenosa]MBD8527279.1 hypothetical protein [Pseudomarimonas arenosa]
MTHPALSLPRRATAKQVAQALEPNSLTYHNHVRRVAKQARIQPDARAPRSQNQSGKSGKRPRAFEKTLPKLIDRLTCPRHQAIRRTLLLQAPGYVCATSAAAVLGISRQRVLQLYEKGAFRHARRGTVPGTSQPVLLIPLTDLRFEAQRRRTNGQSENLALITEWWTDAQQAASLPTDIKRPRQRKSKG